MSDNDSVHRIAAGPLAATIAASGAELIALERDGLGDVIWPGTPPWPAHAPILFPIVGQVRNDRLSVDGRTYEMGRHGFARRSTFRWLERSAASCRLELRDSDMTRAQFPFAFVLQIGYEIAGDMLVVSFVVVNPGDRVLPASLGTHPAFRWPLRAGRAPTEYAIRFARDETAPLRRLRGGLLDPAPLPSPLHDGRTLSLAPELFVDDALIFTCVASREVRYGAADGPSIVVGWEGFTQLGIWSKPGGAFVCIEPWHGSSSPVDFDGDFREKPGLMHIVPGAQAELRLTITATP